MGKKTETAKFDQHTYVVDQSLKTQNLTLEFKLYNFSEFHYNKC